MSSAQIVPELTTRSDARRAADEGHKVPTQAGVIKVEAVQNRNIWGRWAAITLFIGVALANYIYSLDGVTTWIYTAFATSDFQQHSLLGAVTTVAAIVLSVGKPVAAKLADSLGRAEAWTISVVVYALGYVILAASNNVYTYAGGWIIRSAGNAAMGILLTIIVADVVSLRWRTLVNGLLSSPYFVNAFVGSIVAANVVDGSGWRWGYGMFAILLPACSVPIIGILLWSQFKAYKMGIIHCTNPYEADQAREETATKSPIVSRLISWCREMDFVGTLLFGIGWTSLLLPLTLANGGTLPWSSYKIITMLVLGPIIVVAFTFYEGYVARYPIIAARFFTNRTVLFASLIGFFDFISFYAQYSYQYSFIYIVKPWSTTDMNYFAQIQTIALCLFCIIAGALVARFGWYKLILIIGLCVRMLGVGLMIHSKGANGNTAELVMAQFLQGAGGGVASGLCGVIAQGASPHQDLASVTAFTLIAAEIGGAIGTAITAAMWRNIMPGQLQRNLAAITDQATIDGIFASITSAADYAYDSPIRQGTIAAYDHTMKIILIFATVFSIFPIIMACLMTDIKLDQRRNAVENTAAARGQTDSFSDRSSIDGDKKDSETDEIKV